MCNHESINFLLHEKEWGCLVITYCGRSGSYFLHSMLDGHKDILALPPWCATFYSHFVNQNVAATTDTLHINTIAEIFSFEISRLSSMDQFKPKLEGEESGFSMFCAQLGANQDIIYRYDADELTKTLHMVLAAAADDKGYVSRKNIFLAFYIAYGMTTGLSLDTIMQKKTLLYQMHAVDSQQLKLMRNDFDKLTHIISAKHPVQALYSQMRHYKLTNTSIHYCNVAIYNNFLGGMIQPYMNAHNTLAVKIELLNKFGPLYMRAILSHIGLDWDNACNDSTINGALFWWKKVTSAGSSVTTGFNVNDSESVCSIKNVSCEDKILLSHLFKNMCSAWHYAICPSEKSSRRGPVLNRRFDFLSELGFSAEDCTTLSATIWDCYIKSVESANEYAPVISFDSPQEESVCSV